METEDQDKVTRMKYAGSRRINSPGEQLLTMLVMFDPQPADRWSARALAGSFMAAKCVFEQAPVGDLVPWLNALMNSRIPSSACTIVFALPDDYSSEVACQIDEFLQRTQEASRHDVGLVAAVASNTPAWANCASIDGFVCAAPGRTVHIGLQIFDMLSSLMAPGMVTCMDTEDLGLALGSAQAPSQVCQGVWVSVDAALTLSKADRATLAKSATIACMMAATLPLASLRQLVREIRAVASEAEFLMVIPYGLTAVMPASDRMMPVQLLCKGSCCSKAVGLLPSEATAAMLQEVFAS